MRKLAAAVAALTLAVPAIAEPEIKEWNTPHSMGCMLLRECTEGVHRVESIDNVMAMYPGVDFSEIEKEITDLLATFEELGIEVYLAQDKYFMPRTRGVYTTDGNKFFLNLKYNGDPETLLSVVRHEDGMQHKTAWQGHFIIVQLQLFIKMVTSQTVTAFALTLLMAVVLLSLGKRRPSGPLNNPTSQQNALRACAHPGGKMWDVYPPTPMTGEWLIDNGYWDGETK